MVTSMVFSMVAGYAAQVFASRALGAEIYGLYGLVVSNSMMLAGFFDPGLSGAMATYVADEDAKRNYSNIKDTAIWGNFIELLLIFIVIICIIFVSNDIINNLFLGGNEKLIFIFVLLFSFQGFYGVQAGILQGLRELKSLSIVRVIQQLLFFTFIFYFIFLKKLGIAAALNVRFLSIFISLLITLALVIFYLYKIKNSDNYFFKTTNYRFHIKRIVKFAFPVSIAAVITGVILNSGPFFLNILTNNNPGEVLGIFVVLLTIGKAFDRLVKTIARTGFPYLVNWETSGNKYKSKLFIIIMVVAILIGYLFLIIVMNYFGDDFIRLIYGTEYIKAANYLPNILIAFCFISIQDVLKVALFSKKLQYIFLLLSIAGLIVYLFIIFANVIQMDNLQRIILGIVCANLVIIIPSVYVYLNNPNLKDNTI